MASCSPHQLAEAYAFSKLAEHLRMRTDVQNIDVMILAGFCRNCLSKWYHVGAAKAGLATSYDDACERVYGMTYKEWKQTHQSKASEEQLRRMEETKALHAKHETPPPVAPAAPAAPAPPPAPAPTQPATASGGMSDVCCVPPEELELASGAAVACARPALPPVTTPVEIRLGVLTVSDRAARGEYADLSGPEIEKCMTDFAASPAGSAWRLSVARRAVVPDEKVEISFALTQWSDAPPGAASPCTLILTTGGTGLAPRDVTPEATSALLDRAAPGIVELLLRESLKVEPLAALSRAAAGIRGRTLLINLPGRPKAVRENLAVLMPLLAHALLELQ